MIAPKRTSGRRISIIAIVAVAVATAAPVAKAQLGGAYASSPPAITGVTCNTNCAGLEKVKPGSTLRVTGARMGGVRNVIFTGRRGNRDDKTATVISRDVAGVDVRVPAKAESGKLKVVNGDGNESKPSRKTIKVVGASVKGKRLEARAESRRVFVFDGFNKTALRFFVGANGAAEVTIGLARKGDPAILASWTQTSIPSGSVRTIEWDGRLGGLQAPDGGYEFRLSASSAGARASQNNSLTEGFSVLSYRFPVDGPHKYAGGAGRFGAGRDHGDHQGQDVFAKCGTPLLAARGGLVVKRGLHSNAGNYLVIDGDGDGSDHVYMHLRRRALFNTGARVRTGELIGEVGQTGRASGCHLHFEVWPGGWQKGQPIDPLPTLKSWDK